MIDLSVIIRNNALLAVTPPYRAYNDSEPRNCHFPSRCKIKTKNVWYKTNTS